MKTIILLLSLIVIISAASPPRPRCTKPNEEYESCSPNGYQTCDKTDIYDVCKPNCYCKYGFVRNRNNDCVKRKGYCKKCYDDERFIDGGKETNCDGSVSTKPPSSNCYCKNGLYRDTDGYCVPKDECLVQEPVCPYNEEYTTCGTACPKTCANQNLMQRCILLCVPGCFCKSGYVRNDDGVCVLPTECPKETPQCKLDPGNEVYKECGTACPLTCDQPKPWGCTRQCVPGCFCKDGLVRNRWGSCVRAKKCNLDEGEKCPVREFFSRCSAHCQPSCGVTRGCDGSCLPRNGGCVCIPPLIRDGGTGDCVLPAECSNLYDK